MFFDVRRECLAMNFASMIRAATCCGVVDALVVGCAVRALVAPALPRAGGEFQPLEIATKTGVQVFSVEMATTEEEKTTGLMYRKELPDGQGMLFDFSPEQQVSMWMKNTYISLDMIFIRADGRILRIAENTEPLSTRIISSGGPGQRRSRGDRGHRAKNTASRPATGSRTRCSTAIEAIGGATPCWRGLKRVSTSFPNRSGYSAAW